MVEKNEADDKIIAVLIGDPTFGDFTEIDQLPRPIVDRLRHYFLTYKLIPGDQPQTISVDPIYGTAFASRVLEAARADYQETFTADRG
jgi:inorganic pyrophosphatase